MRFAYDYGQLYIHDATWTLPTDGNAYLDALDAATASAARWSYDDPDPPGDRYRLELWPSEHRDPPAELRRWPGYADRL